MNSSASAGRTETAIRPSKHAAARLKTDDSLCSFCQNKAAAVTVQRPVRHRRKKRTAQPLCLLHYYSTSAVREDPSQHVAVRDDKEMKAQMPEMQELFAEAFVQLQQKIQDETARSFAAHQQDPLAVLTDLHHRPRKPPPRKTAAAAKRSATNNDASGGGFLRPVPLPERLVQTQQAQARQQAALLQRMKRATDISQRRKPTRKSIWNTILEEPPRKVLKPGPAAVAEEAGPPCSCGSTNVQEIGSHTSRNQDATKGEIWGTKDRGDDVIGRYQCLSCGKLWNETS